MNAAEVTDAMGPRLSQRARVLVGCAPTLHQRRALVFHVPVLTGAAKVAGLAAGVAVKKFAVTKVLQKIGPQRAVQELRDLNRNLQSRGVYSSMTAKAADESIDALDGLLKEVREDERVTMIWNWYVELEKRNPTLAAAVVKSYLESMPGMKWASVLLKDAKPTDKSVEETAAGTTTGGPLDEAEVKKQSSLLQRMHAQFPELTNYHVVLVPRDTAKK